MAAARLAADGRGEAAATVLAGGGRRAKRDAEAAAERGTVCASMPRVSEALADGTVSAGHVDAIVNAARHLDDDGKAELVERSAVLVNAAATMSPEEFDREVNELARSLAGDGGLSRHERLRRQRNVRRWTDKRSGMCKTLLSLDPLDDAKVWTAFNAAVAAARSANQHDDDAAGTSCKPTPSSTTSPANTLTTPPQEAVARGPEVSVLIDYSALFQGGDARVAETADGQPLPVEVIRRLGCDGNLIPIWLDGDGEVLAVGPATPVGPSWTT
jgi:Domain of unknown function (DUF222)